jgi:uncharacterized protein (TIGR02145 family)
MVILHDYTMNRHNLATTCLLLLGTLISLHSCINNPKSLAAENTAPADVKTVADKTSPSAARASNKTVTFPYNGSQVTYGVIISAKTGRQWLDRNLGATRVATTYNDHLAYGDLFQWGRAADGHQLIRWSAADTGSPLNGATAKQSTTGTPDHDLFIRSGLSPFDWLSRQDHSLWQFPAYANNPCPNGWHIPTDAEWRAEFDGNLDSAAVSATDAFIRLKLTTTGLRTLSAATLFGNGMATSYGVGGSGYYWSSSPAYDYFVDALIIYRDKPAGETVSHSISLRGDGYACRCINNGQ